MHDVACHSSGVVCAQECAHLYAQGKAQGSTKAVALGSQAVPIPKVAQVHTGTIVPRKVFEMYVGRLIRQKEMFLDGAALTL